MSENGSERGGYRSPRSERRSPVPPDTDDWAAYTSLHGPAYLKAYISAYTMAYSSAFSSAYIQTFAYANVTNFATEYFKVHGRHFTSDIVDAYLRDFVDDYNNYLRNDSTAPVSTPAAALLSAPAPVPASAPAPAFTCTADSATAWGAFASTSSPTSTTAPAPALPFTSTPASTPAWGAFASISSGASASAPAPLLAFTSIPASAADPAAFAPTSSPATARPSEGSSLSPADSYLPVFDVAPNLSFSPPPGIAFVPTTLGFVPSSVYSLPSVSPAFHVYVVPLHFNHATFAALAETHARAHNHAQALAHARGQSVVRYNASVVTQLGGCQAAPPPPSRHRRPEASALPRGPSAHDAQTPAGAGPAPGQPSGKAVTQDFQRPPPTLNCWTASDQTARRSPALLPALLPFKFQSIPR